jgi:hypothetical protein
VRTAAAAAFLEELKSKRAGDLNGVLVTFNDGSLCREALSHWLLKQWIVIAPHSPLTALPGPGFTRDLTVRQFCGEPAAPESAVPFGEREDENGDEDS